MKTGTILQEKYKDNVVCFRNMASWIVRDQRYNNKRSNADEEAK